MDLVKVYVGRDGMDAHFVKAELEATGIEATVMGENLSIARGDLPLTVETLPSVWVRDVDADAAKKIVQELSDRQYAHAHDAEVPQLRPDWVCAECGEHCEGQFDACWNCGALRPEDATIV